MLTTFDAWGAEYSVCTLFSFPQTGAENPVGTTAFFSKNNQPHYSPYMVVMNFL